MECVDNLLILCPANNGNQWHLAHVIKDAYLQVRRRSLQTGWIFSAVRERRSGVVCTDAFAFGSAEASRKEWSRQSKSMCLHKTRPTHSLRNKAIAASMRPSHVPTRTWPCPAGRARVSLHALSTAIRFWYSLLVFAVLATTPLALA